VLEARDIVVDDTGTGRCGGRDMGRFGPVPALELGVCDLPNVTILDLVSLKEVEASSVSLERIDGD
jgi:hypothetical protein